ncbi:MAG: calcium-binding protein, partial [Proteobacteria bacterium]
MAIEDASDALGKTRPGNVAFYRTNGTFLASVHVGSLPDMLTFTPDGNHVLVANEGEPNSYNQPDSVDPEGTVSIIPVPQGFGLFKKLRDADVRTVDFRVFNGKLDSLRQMGIRIYGPNATVAQDLEPEYITVTPDSKTAYVTLQENNAVAKIDIASGRVFNLLPLGYKDWNGQPFTTATFEWPSESLPSIGTTTGGQDIRLGGFSGLVYEGATHDGKLRFIVNTDRGPNGEPNANAERPFLLPSFAPRLVRFTLDPVTGKFELTEQIELRRPEGSPLTGLPNTAIAGATTNSAHNDEVPIDLFGRVLPLDPLGGDFEGLVVADDGSFWLCDEYRPALYHFDPKGVLLERYVPIGVHAAAGLAVPAAGTAGALGIEALPAVLGQRRQNRGMEALALKGGKLYAFVQSPLRNPVSTSNAVLNGLRNVRVIEFDLATRATTQQFLYVMDNPVGSGNDTRADKIGDAVSVPGGFLVVERDDDATTDDPATNDPLATITKRIYRFDLSGATNL